MKFIALKDLPTGTKPGEEFEANEDEGRILMTVGAARKIEDDPPVERAKRHYRRRDLEAESDSEA